MTFADLFDTLTTRGVLPRAKDCKTALKELAHALGSPSMEDCQVDTARLKEATWGEALDAHFQLLATQGRMISGGNRRNMKSNLRTVFRLAEAHGLLAAPLPLVLLTKPRRAAFEREQRATAPYRSTYHPTTGPRRYRLREEEWPADIAQAWRRYRAKCPIGRRETTFRAYAIALGTYLGYLVHVCGHTPTWEDVFDQEQLTDFVRWHAARLGADHLTVWGRRVGVIVAAMAKVMQDPRARELADWRNTLKPPAPVHNKRAHHWVSLLDLTRAAERCLAEGRAPLAVRRDNQHPGAQRAAAFQRGLILKLLVEIPLRQRNVRELRWDEHFEKDQHGHWRLILRGKDLKVGTRGGQANTYEVDLTEGYKDLLQLFEDWRNDFRPRLPGATTSQYVFLTGRGNPFSQTALYAELSCAVAMHTGKRFYPHLIRTIWATEYLEEYPGDYAGAADALGDTVATVMKTYVHLDRKALQAKRAAFVRKKLAG